MNSKSILIFAIGIFILSQLGCRAADDYIYKYNPPNEKVNSYEVSALAGRGKVDMLWVIDNSGSMQSYQDSVAANMSLFIEAFSRATYVSWKIGMISTDVKDDPYIGLVPGESITATSPSVIQTFNAAVTKLGISGDATERTFDPVINALNKFPNFLSPGAALAIIVVSDAPEQSTLSVADFVSKLSIMMRGNLEKVSVFGILGPKDLCKPTDDTWEWKGSRFEELSNYVKVKTFPICDPNFSRNLVSIGKDIVALAERPRIFLKERPVISSIKVKYNGVELRPGTKEEGGFWFYQTEENAVVIENIQFLENRLNDRIELIYVPDDGVSIKPEEKLDVKTK